MPPGPTSHINWFDSALAARLLGTFGMTRLRFALSALMCTAAVAGGTPVHSVALQASSAISGRIVDRATDLAVTDALVVLDGTNHSSVSDADGRFRFRDVVPGEYTLRIRHIAYGNQSRTLSVEAGRDVAVQLVISQTAIELDPIVLEVYSADELRRRAAGFATNVVTRQELERLEGTNLNVGEVLRMRAPGVRVRRWEGVPGAPICIELRATARSSPRECNSPAVYLDGVPVAAPETLYGALALSDIERMEIIPSVEAGVRYGGSLYGALLIETRRPGLELGEEETPEDALPLNFDWSQESSRHSTARVYGYSLIGAGAGLALGLLVADQCLGLRDPSFDSVVSDCGAWPTMGSAAAAVALPALGAAVAARYSGQTDLSRGNLVPAALAAGMVLVPGYALVLSGRRSETGTGAVQWIGHAILALGTPLATTLADKLYRSLRN